MICPYCRSKNVIPIIYGFPGPDMFVAAEKGEIKLGGCVIRNCAKINLHLGV